VTIPPLPKGKGFLVTFCMNKNQNLNQKEVKWESRRVVKEILDSERREDHHYNKAFVEMLHNMVRDKISVRGYVRGKKEKD